MHRRCIDSRNCLPHGTADLVSPLDIQSCSLSVRRYDQLRIVSSEFTVYWSVLICPVKAPQICRAIKCIYHEVRASRLFRSSVETARQLVEINQ